MGKAGDRWRSTVTVACWMAGLSLALGLIPGASAGQAGQEKLSLDVHAHRGGAGLAPENTLAAFRQALELGVDVLEMDLHVTRDGAVVVIHDATIDRTTNGRGAVSDHTLETLRGYDAGVKFAPQFAGERIPALRQVIELVQASGRATVRLNLETKFAKGREGKPSDFEERVLAILRETGFVDRTILQSFYHPSLAKMKGLEPRIKLAALLGRDEPRDPVGMMRQLHADYYSPNFQQATPAVIASLHQAGIPVVVWTVNETADAERLLDAGLGRLAGDGIITNFPDRILDLLRPRR